MIERITPGLEQVIEAISLLGDKPLKATLMYHDFRPYANKQHSMMIKEFDEYSVCYKYCGVFETREGFLDVYEFFSILRKQSEVLKK
jgi:hypothetical protein